MLLLFILFWSQKTLEFRRKILDLWWKIWYLFEGGWKHFALCVVLETFFAFSYTKFSKKLGLRKNFDLSTSKKLWVYWEPWVYFALSLAKNVEKTSLIYWLWIPAARHHSSLKVNLSMNSHFHFNQNLSTRRYPPRVGLLCGLCDLQVLGLSFYPRGLANPSWPA